MLFNPNTTIKTMGILYRKAQTKGYYSTSHSLASAVAWASLHCPSLSGSAIVRLWTAGYNN